MHWYKGISACFGKYYLDYGMRKGSQTKCLLGAGPVQDGSSIEPKLCSISKGGSLYSTPLFFFFDKKNTICRSWQLIQNILKHCVGWTYVLRVYLAPGLLVWDLWCKGVVPKPGCRSESSVELKKHRCPVPFPDLLNCISGGDADAQPSLRTTEQRIGWWNSINHP